MPQNKKKPLRAGTRTGAKKNISMVSITGKREIVKMDYSKLYEITVKSQEELNAIPDDFSGRIYVEFGTPFSKAVINRRF